MNLRIPFVTALVLASAAFASACATSTGSGADSSPARPTSVAVNGDAALDIGPVQAAINKVADGGIVKLEAGTYDFGTEQLMVAKSVRLLGAGSGATEIVGSAKKAVIIVRDAETFSAEGISFVKVGRSLGGALAIEGGQIQLTRCRFTGSSHTKNWSWAALWIKGDTSGTVRDCVATKADSGLDISGKSTVSIEDSKFSSNRLFGLGVYGDARPLIRANSFAKNGNAGIYAYSRARPQIEANTFSGGNWGIYVDGKVHATIDSNKCSAQDEQAIKLEGSSHVRVVDNRLTTSRDGILLVERAEATIDGNTVRSNRETGIYVGDRAKARVTDNTVERNGEKDTGGICIAGHGRATVMGNRCSKNGSYGILFRDNGGGSVTRNYCSDNKYGVLINDQAYPKVSGNHCSDNSESNIETYRGA